jgi:hypothetical protein
MVGTAQFFRISTHVDVDKQERAGVGGMVLPDGGEDVNTREISLLGSHTWTLSPALLNTLRLGWTGTLTRDVPTSNAVRIFVPGFFESGGAEQQDHMDHRSQIQLEDALTLDHHRHLFRFGLEVKRYGDFLRDEADFNGAYLFGGTVAPQLDSDGRALAGVPGAYISGLEQYRRTLLGLPGGAPSEFRIANGAPAYGAAQWRFALYGEDQMHLSDRATLTLGARLQKQTIPAASLIFNPRFGMSYSVDRKRRTVCRADRPCGLCRLTTDGERARDAVDLLSAAVLDNTAGVERHGDSHQSNSAAFGFSVILGAGAGIGRVSTAEALGAARLMELDQGRSPAALEQHQCAGGDR